MQATAMLLASLTCRYVKNMNVGIFISREIFSVRQVRNRPLSLGSQTVVYHEDLLISAGLDEKRRLFSTVSLSTVAFVI